MTKIILAGFGGQGILFAGKVLANAAMMRNKHISWLPSYGPEMRGGTANCSVIISEEPIGSPIITRPDVLAAMNGPSLDKFEGEVVPGGIIAADSSLVGREIKRDDVRTVYESATEVAAALGTRKLANMVLLGALMRETGLFSLEELGAVLRRMTPPEKPDLLAANIRAVEAGFNGSGR